MTTISSFEMKSGAHMPRTLRLTSQATYHRAHRDSPGAGTMRSTYDDSVGAAAAEAARRCPQQRAAAKLNDLVHDVVTKIPAETYDKLKMEAEEAAAHNLATNTLSSTGSSLSFTAKTPASLDATVAPLLDKQVDSFANLSQKMDATERHGIRGAMVKDFFGAGSIEGPFPGARSAQGDWMASTFYAHARPFGGAFATLKPSPYSDSGYKLNNYNKIG